MPTKHLTHLAGNLFPRITSALMTLLLLSMVPNAWAAVLRGELLDIAGNPVPGATAQLVHYVYLAPQPADLVPLDETQSDSRGMFSLSVPDRPTSYPYAVLCTREGMQKTWTGVDVSKMGDSPLKITLLAGAGITGTVTAENGLPLKNITVGPLVPMADEESGKVYSMAPQWTVTDILGRFTFNGVAPGVQYVVTAHAEGRESGVSRCSSTGGPANLVLRKGGNSARGVFTGRGLSQSSFQGIRVRMIGSGVEFVTSASAEGVVDFSGIPSGEYAVEALLPPPKTIVPVHLSFPRQGGVEFGLNVTGGYYVSGTTVDWDTGEILGGVPLRILDRETISRADGSFRIGPLDRTGDIRLHCVTQEPARWKILSRDDDPGFMVADADGYHDVTSVTARIKQGRLVRVHCLSPVSTTEALSLQILSDSGSPWAVTITSPTVEIPLFDGGRYAMYLEGMTGLSALHGVDIKPGASQVRTFTTVLEPGGQSIRSDYKSAESSGSVLMASLREMASVEGRVVVASDGGTSFTPCEGALVEIRAADEWSTQSHVLVLGETRVDAEGKFRFPRLPRGVMHIKATNAARSQEKDLFLEITPGQNLVPEIRFEGGKRFSGRVIGPDKSVIPAVTLRYYARSSTGIGVTDSGKLVTDGNGVFSSTEVRGDVVELVTIEQANYAPFDQKNIPLPAENLEFQLNKEGLLRIKVESDPEIVWRLALLRSRPMGTAPYPEQLITETVERLSIKGGEEGTIKPPEAGRYLVLARGRINTMAISPIIEWDPRKAKDESITLVPGKTGRIEGKLVNAPRSGVKISATNTALPDEAEVKDYQVETREDSFVLEDLQPGDYLVHGEGDGWAAAATNVKVAPGETARVTLRPATLATVTGRILNMGKPVADQEVSLIGHSSVDKGPRKSTTNRNGEFQFEAVEPDRYTVELIPGQGPRTIRRLLTVTREESPEPLEIDIRPPGKVRFQLKGSRQGGEMPVMIVHKETREMIQARPSAGGYEVEADPGQYEINLGDMPAGTLQIDSNGKTSVDESALP